MSSIAHLTTCTYDACNKLHGLDRKFDVFEQHNARGVPGVGTVNHCFHGSHASTTDEIVDWAPFEHLTFTTTVGPLGRMWVTWALEPLTGRTMRIRHRFAIAEGFAPMSPQVAEAWRERAQADVDRLAQLVATRRALRGR